MPIMGGEDKYETSYIFLIDYKFCGFEEEYIVASVVVCEAIWLRMLLTYLFGQILEPTLVHCDNQSCVRLSVNPASYDKSKHVEIKYLYIRDMVQKGAMNLYYISIDE